MPNVGLLNHIATQFKKPIVEIKTYDRNLTHLGTPSTKQQATHTAKPAGGIDALANACNKQQTRNDG